MRGRPPRDLLGLFSGRGFSFERLVFPEVRNAQSQGIDRDEFVGDVDLKRNTQFAVYRSRFSSLWSAGE